MSSGPHIFFNEVNERQGMFHRRAFLMGGVIGAGVLTLSGRLMQLQLVEAGRYRSMSEGNQFNYRLIPPPRGRIGPTRRATTCCCWISPAPPPGR